MKTFIISLKKSLERRQLMQNSLNDMGIEFTFFDAIDGSQEKFLHNNKAVPHKTKKRFGYSLTDGEIACYASHYLMWEKCVELNETILILEDNGTFTDTEQFKACFPLFEKIADKYDFIKLGGSHHSSKKSVKTHLLEAVTPEINLIRYSKRNAGTVGYLITPNAAKQFLKNSDEFLEAVDNFIEKPWRHSIKAYCFQPNLLIRVSSTIPSIIGLNRKNKKQIKSSHRLYKEIYKAYEKIQYKLYK